MKQADHHDLIDELLTRGVVNIIPGKEELARVLRSGKKLNVYLGIDPTATRIHLGHAVNLRKLQLFIELGHQVTFLIGDFTARVGDNSDKESERPILTTQEIEKNFQTYKEQAQKILDFSRAKIRFNSEWLSRLTFGDVLRLCQQFSLNDYLAREIMKKKLEAGVSIRLDEVLYPLMQGYDSYTMDTDVQVGAADQTFNMQAGRVLQKKLRGKESFVLVNDYLIGTDGRKMSKSWDNAIWLSDTAENMFGKTMSLKDELIEPYFVLGTKTSLGQIQEMKNRLAKGENPMVLKKELAKIIVTEFHGQAKADQAQHQFEKQFQEKTFSEASLNEVIYEPNTDFASFLIAGGCASSKAEVKSLIKDGAVQKQQANGFVRLKTEPLAIKDGDVFKVGRKLIKVKARA